MIRQNVCSRLALGALAGLGGTMAIQGLLNTRRKILPNTMPPIKEEPGHFIIRKTAQVLPGDVERQLSEKAKSIGAKVLGMGYGMSFGAIYALARPKSRQILVDGVILGLFTWAAGYLGWLPGTKLMPPIWKQKIHQAALPVAEHALYGIATVAGHRWLKTKTAS